MKLNEKFGYLSEALKKHTHIMHIQILKNVIDGAGGRFEAIFFVDSIDL